jgi:hypothetical protein
VKANIKSYFEQVCNRNIVHLSSFHILPFVCFVLKIDTMKLSPLLLLASLVLSAPVDSIPDPFHGSAAFQAAMALKGEPASGVKNETSLTKFHNKYKTYMKSVLTSRGPHAACNANNVQIRREWYHPNSPSNPPPN